LIADITIYESGDGGDLNLVNDDLETIQGLTNQVYLALFGGNIEQVTSEDLEELEQRRDWWGNYLLNEDNQFNSTFERTLRETALNSAGLRTIVNAAREDLRFLEDYGDIGVVAQIVGVNRIVVTVTISEPDQQSVKLQIAWDGTRAEVITEKTI
jgi:phage gp46-like protein